MKKRILNFGSLLAVIALPFGSFGCSFDPNAQITDPERKITSSEIEEASVFFIESLFNSNYFQKILLTHNLAETNREMIVQFAQGHPQLQKLDSETIDLINNYLKKININKIEDYKVISIHCICKWT